jgi:hypothetical protein
MKCKYSYKCKHYNPDGYTCNTYDAEDGYCPLYREFDETIENDRYNQF